jgi:LPPG:FO 2-phospho-L-lactate transferase
VTVVLLSGGTGGAKLARGLADFVGDELVVVANTGDDIEVYGAHVSPDPDLITYWLADRIDARGWGIAGDSFNVMDGLRELGVDVWFNLGDRDLAVCIERRRRLEQGARLTEAIGELCAALGVQARVVPMSDAPVRTHIRTGGEWLALQEFLIVSGGEGAIEDVDFRGARDATPTTEVLAAIAAARAIVIGPSNPVISIGPILALDGIHAALRAADAPVVAVSPVVDGEILKGPTERFLRWAGQPATSAGVAAYYGDLIDGIVSDERVDGLASLVTPTLMDDAEARRRVAEQTLAFAGSLAG